MSVRDYLTVEAVAADLGCEVAEALDLIRRAGPVGAVRIEPRKLLVPPSSLEQLRAAHRTAHQ